MQFLKKQNSHRYILIILMILLAFFGIHLFLEQGNVQKEEQNPKGNFSEEIFSLTQADQSLDAEEILEINLTGQQESGVISQGGSYRLSGEYEQTLYVDAEDEMVHLLFDNVNIHSEEGPAIHILSAGKVIITLVEGTENVLADAPVYPVEEEAKAALYSSCDLTINGSGRLSVYGYYENGIYSRDVLKLLQGSFFVQAKKDALRGSDGVLIQLSDLEIECEGNGIVTANTGKKNRGAIDIGAGNISIIAGKYGMVTPADLYIHDCQLYNKSVIAEYQVSGESNIDERCYIHE